MSGTHNQADPTLAEIPNSPLVYSPNLVGRNTVEKIALIHAELDIRDILDKMTAPELGKVWSQLNSFEWPDILPSRDEFNLVSTFQPAFLVGRDDEATLGSSQYPPNFQLRVQQSRASILMLRIMEAIGYVECLRAWNTQPRGLGKKPLMTDSEFEAWVKARGLAPSASLDSETEKAR